MGNLMTCLVKGQVEMLGIGTLDPKFVKRCIRCGVRAYTSGQICRHCGGLCRAVSENTTPTIIDAIDPETGRMGRFVMDRQGALHPLGRSDHYHRWSPAQSRANLREAARAEERRKKEEEEQEAVELPLVEDITSDEKLEAITQLADILDPDRQIVPQIPESMSVGLPLTEDDEELSENEDYRAALHRALEQIHCPVCLTEFSKPTTLPCGHSLCRVHTCDLDGKCPICRDDFPKGLYRDTDRVNVTLENYTRAVKALETLTKSSLNEGPVSHRVECAM